MYGLSPVLNVTASVVSFTTDLMAGIFGPISCSGNDWLIEVLQYTVYPVMIPLLGIGTDQLAWSAIGDPGTGDNIKLGGDDGTDGESIKPLLSAGKYVDALYMEERCGFRAIIILLQSSHLAIAKLEIE